MVKKVLVKQDAGLKQAGGGAAVSCEVVDAQYPDEASYGVHLAGSSKHFEDVAEATDVDNEGFEFAQDFQTYASEENIICAPDVLLAAAEVEVAAYATLAADGRSGAVPAVLLEANSCPMGCGTVIKSENHLRGHLKETHAMSIQMERKLFPNMGSFLSWKEARERESSRRYVIRETRHNWRRFACSRSGHPSGTDRPQRWKRTGNFCPAFIRTSTCADGSVKARYCLFHTCSQPDNSVLPSDRELAKANQQLGLLEQVISQRQPKKKRRGTKRAWDAAAEPGRSPEARDGQIETQPQLGSPHTVDDDGLLSGTPLDTVTLGRRPSWSTRGGKVPHRLAFSTTPDKGKISAPEGDQSASSDTEEDQQSTVKRRVRTNLLRLHAKLERASASEARQMLASTEEMLERFTTIRRRGRTGTVLRGRGRPLGHQHAARTEPFRAAEQSGAGALRDARRAQMEEERAEEEALGAREGEEGAW